MAQQQQQQDRAKFIQTTVVGIINNYPRNNKRKAFDDLIQRCGGYKTITTVINQRLQNNDFAFTQITNGQYVGNPQALQIASIKLVLFRILFEKKNEMINQNLIQKELIPTYDFSNELNNSFIEYSKAYDAWKSQQKNINKEDAQISLYNLSMTPPQLEGIQNNGNQQQLNEFAITSFLISMAVGFVVYQVGTDLLLQSPAACNAVAGLYDKFPNTMNTVGWLLAPVDVEQLRDKALVNSGQMTEEQVSDEVLGQEEAEEVELADEALTEYENNMTAAIEAAFNEDYGMEEETETA